MHTYMAKWVPTLGYDGATLAEHKTHVDAETERIY